MEALIVMLALVALAAAALLWGADSREVHASGGPRRWFVELDGKALKDTRQVRGRRVGARRALPDTVPPPADALAQAQSSGASAGECSRLALIFAQLSPGEQTAPLRGLHPA